MTQLEEYDNREFMVLNVSELNEIAFSQVLETSSEPVINSINGTKTFVKWDGTMPTCVSNLTTKEGPYTYEQILVILATPEWTDQNHLMMTP